MPSTQTAVKYFSPSTSIIEHPEDANSDFLVTGAAVVGAAQRSCGQASWSVIVLNAVRMSQTTGFKVPAFAQSLCFQALAAEIPSRLPLSSPPSSYLSIATGGVQGANTRIVSGWWR